MYKCFFIVLKILYYTYCMFVNHCYNVFECGKNRKLYIFRWISYEITNKKVKYDVFTVWIKFLLGIQLIYFLYFSLYFYFIFPTNFFVIVPCVCMSYINKYYSISSFKFFYYFCFILLSISISFNYIGTKKN